MTRLFVLGAVIVIALTGVIAFVTSDSARAVRDACAPGRSLDPGTVSRTIESGGRERSYLLHVPESYDETRRTPMVVLFHGLGGDPETVVDATDMVDLAEKNNAILVAPRGAGKVTQWDFRAPISDPGSDLAFVRTLVKHTKREACVDSSRTYAAGFSNGSALTLALACDGSTRFAAYAAVAGPYYPPTCADAPPAAIIYFHGMDDPIVPFSGSNTVIGFLPPVNRTMAQWVNHDRCAPEGATTTATGDVRHFSWSRCRDGSSVDVYAVTDGVHGWPGAGAMSPGGKAGARNSPINASELIWDFFERHPAPADL